MAQNIIRVSTELFPLDDNSRDAIRNRSFYYYRLSPSIKLLKQFGNLYSVYSYVARAFQDVFSYATTLQSGDGLELVSPVLTPQRTIYPNGGQGDEWKIDVVSSREPCPLNLEVPEQHRALLHLFYESQKNAFSNQGYAIRGNSFYRIDDVLSLDIPVSKNPFLRKIQPFIHAYPSFEIQFRAIQGLPFIQIQPKTVLEFEKDLHSLVTEGILTPEEIGHHFEDVYLPIHRTVHLVGFISKRAKDPIDNEPFNGRSFLEYARDNYKRIVFQATEARLLIIVVGTMRTPWYFTSEHVRPSISFSSLARYDPQYVGYLTSAMKAYSARRGRTLENLQKSLTFSFLDVKLKTTESFSRDGPDIEIRPEQFSNEDMARPFLRFPRPWVSFRDANGNVIDVGEPPYLAAPGDLLKHRTLRPFDVPKSPADIRLKVICDARLENDARALIQKLRSGFGKYPSFQQIFRCPIKIADFRAVQDFDDSQAYSDVSPQNYDCVLVIGPRSIAEDPVRTKWIYTFAETQILDRGVPPQFVSDDPSSNPSYDASLKSKAQNPNALFGIGLNILGKIGARVLDLSPKSLGFFIPNSAVLAYNVARIFEPFKQDIFHSSSPRDIVKASTPLSAPIVIMTDRGTEIIHQYAHRISSETALFSPEHGSRILSEIPTKYTKVIVHKDGPFFLQELSDLKKLQTKERVLIPLSIISGKVPRLRTSIAKINFLPKPGLLFRLSPKDFLLSTTLVTMKYIPEERGWPNPIWIRIHDEILPEELTGREKLQLLYQIWVFTRLHLGSENPIRKPISIHYSNQMAEFLRKAGDAEPAYFRIFSGKRNRHGYIPRVFM